MNFFSRFNIRYQLLILAASTVLIMIAIFFVYYSENAAIIVKKNTEYTSETILQIRQNVQNYCESVSRLVTSMSYTILVQDCMLETDRLKRFELDQQTVDLLNKTQKIIGDGVVDIVILGDNGNTYTLNGNTAVVNRVKEVFQDKTAAYFTGIEDVTYSGNVYKCFLVGMQVVSVDENYDGIGEKIGYFCVVINADEVSPSLGGKTGTDYNKFYLVDRENRVFSSNDAAKYGSRLDVMGDLRDYTAGVYRKSINGRMNLVQIDELPDLGGKIVSIVPESDLFKELVSVRKQTLIWFAVAIAFLSIPFSIIINNILHPLKKFMGFIKDVKSGNLKTLKKRIQLEGYMEMSVMSQEFNSMLDEIDSLTHRLVDTGTMLYQSELEKKQSELAFLQSQINPHFLYNTLESIKGIAAVRGVGEIRDMTRALSLILQYSIKGMEEVALKEEVDIVKSYIQIQQIRFSNRFSVEYDLSDEALGYKVPKMILQPVVENAIYHGLEPMLEKGELVVSGYVDDSGLVLCVRDNGIGIEESALEELRGKLDRTASAGLAGAAGIGIVNVNNRLRLKYGEGCGITIRSGPGRGTEIFIKIPTEG